MWYFITRSAKFLAPKINLRDHKFKDDRRTATDLVRQMTAWDMYLHVLAREEN